MQAMFGAILKLISTGTFGMLVLQPAAVCLEYNIGVVAENINTHPKRAIGNSKGKGYQKTKLLQKIIKIIIIINLHGNIECLWSMIKAHEA